ncbi:MAG TPA: GNAT family protein [Ignavibacteriaceae bacterium]
MSLQFEKYQIREFQLNDADAIVNNANNIEVSRFMRDSFPYPYTKENAVQWINFVKKNYSNLSFAISDESEVIGGIGAVPQTDVHRFSAEVGFWLGQLHWNKGIISKALPVFCNYLFTNFNFNRLFANVFEGNEASKKVLEKTGFILEGTLRKSVFKGNKFVDHHIYGLLKEDFII